MFHQDGRGQLGGLDIIVNNAGYTWDSVVQKMTDEQWQAIIDVHLTAPFRILRAAQPVISAKAKEEAAAGQEVFRKVVNISLIWPAPEAMPARSTIPPPRPESWA
ncbi:3-oxoacyl-[acyl-carrier-protein] reductase FabG (plasmid) [Nitratireductor thuwali]|uniref:3-oxoacyl-[acyl-carrier-protein] reductase FabG n=1 Tax=Nitratireductor thuwali TaxID=2267699 RepID=A0ABY5MQZ1_9HYPH|nr:3-oxoacyl-[acyl-carrier-protein] reductase FabG [Nitratireductor thuwali]